MDGQDDAMVPQQHSMSRDASHDQFSTAVTHLKRLYPTLDPSPSPSSSPSRTQHRGSSGKASKTLVGVAGECQGATPPNKEEVVDTDGSLTSSSSGNFVTAQQSLNSKLLELLTSEESAGSMTSGDEATPMEGVASSSSSSSLGVYAAAAAKESTKSADQDPERPRSMQFKGHGPHSPRGSVAKKSPLATSASKAPHLLQDHKSTRPHLPVKVILPRVKEAAPTTTEPLPSAPPLMDICPEEAEIKKVNSYSGLGKRKSAFPVSALPGKQPSLSPESLASERGGGGSSSSEKMNVVSSLTRANPSLSTGALGLAVKMLATGRAGLQSLSPSAKKKKASSAAVIVSSSSYSPGSSDGLEGQSRLLAASKLRLVESGGRGGGGGRHQGEGLLSPSRAAAGRRASLPGGRASNLSSQQAAAANGASGASPDKRAVSWLEHLKSKLPLNH